MGLEGAVRLGFKKELDAISDPAEREKLFQQLLARMYEVGKATEAAAHLEIDAVIDPADTRGVVVRAFAAAGLAGK
jgi:acetyl-CoA carboxylase carboxyltransferase component